MRWEFWTRGIRQKEGVEVWFQRSNGPPSVSLKASEVELRFMFTILNHPIIVGFVPTVLRLRM